MVGQLRHPSAGFEEVIKTHFRLKGPYILTQIEGWIEEAKTSPTSGHKKALEKQLKLFKEELAKLAGEGLGLSSNGVHDAFAYLEPAYLGFDLRR